MKKNDQRPLASLISLGRLVNTHGVRGELRLLPHSFPCHTISPGLTVFLHRENEPPRTYTIERVRPRAPFLLVKFAGVDSIEQAQSLRDRTVAIEETSLPPLAEGEFYYYQVVGLTVLTTTGVEIGKISQVFFSGGHDIWVVTNNAEKEYLLPVTEEIVRSIDIPGGRVIIEPMKGLLE